MHISTRSLCVLLTALVALSSTHAADEFGAIPEIDLVFANYDQTTPGCALGVMQGGQFIYRKAYGLANLEHGIPLSSSSVFRIASTSKQFTATAIALLAAREKIRLDDPISRYFPEFPPWANGITVMNLVNHSSGIRDYLQLTWLQGRTDEADFFTDDDIIDLLARQQENNFQAGTDYLYSNSGYLLMAHLVERVTGQSLKDYAEENIFGPLGMENTHFQNDHNQIVPNRAAGYAPTEEGFRISQTTLDLIGDGGVYTTVDDLLLWERNFENNRLGGGAAFIEQLTAPDIFKDGTPMDYAFGLTVEAWRGLDVVHHGGAFVGYRAMFMRFPTEKLAITLLCNRSDSNPGEKAYAIAEHLLADRLEPRETSSSTVTDFHLEAAELARYVGDFWNEEEGFAAETALDEGKLWAVHSPERRNELKPIARDRFSMLDVPARVTVDFEMDGDRVVRMRRTINDRPRGEFIPFQRRQISATELQAYTGNYYSEELRVWYQLYLDGDRLMLKLRGVDPMELTPMFDETFENPDWGAFEFSRDPNQQVKGFRLQSGRVRNLAFEKR